jgi:hypothetical protein
VVEAEEVFRERDLQPEFCRRRKKVVDKRPGDCSVFKQPRRKSRTQDGQKAEVWSLQRCWA